MNKLTEFYNKHKKVISTISVIVLIAVIIFSLLHNFVFKKDKYTEQAITQFNNFIQTDEVKKIKDITIVEDRRLIKYEYDDEKYKVQYPSGGYLSLNPDILNRLSISNAKVEWTKASVSYFDIAFKVLYYFIFIGFGYILFKQIGAFGSEGVSVITDEKTKLTDIAGYPHVKEEIVEFIDFFANPDKYRKYTASNPKGILLVGPPGNGKTLFAKAIAGECNIPFIQVSGSDLEKKFVGSGADQIRSLFAKAKKMLKNHKGVIIFIDEIDAIGIKRESRTVPETSQTINKLLTEMDGFEKDNRILVIAATNLVEVLDPALTRSGRFDRIVNIERPNLRDREQIINLYLHKKNDLIASEVFEKDDKGHSYAYTLAQQTEGFCNADFDKLINIEASLIAHKKESLIDIECLREAFTKIVAGIKTDHQISKEDREIIAYHEAGHAVAQIVLNPLGINSIAYITITPHGKSLGHVSPVSDNKVLYKKSDIENEIKVLLAGRAVEDKILNGDFTTGASSDLDKVNKLLISYSTKYGMSSSFKNLFMEDVDQNNKDFKLYLSEERNKFYLEVENLINNNFDMVEIIANHLLNYEAIDQRELYELLQNTTFFSK